MSVEVIYTREDLIPSFHKTLDRVARERIFIEMIEAPPFENVAEFQKKLIASNKPNFYAVNNGEVIGWVDISVGENPRLNHRGHLGMGLLKDFRGQGIGSRLMKAALEHAKKIGLEKVELSVYSDNLGAIALYKKFGFEEDGLFRNYRKLDGRYFDAIHMSKFL